MGAPFGRVSSFYFTIKKAAPGGAVEILI